MTSEKEQIVLRELQQKTRGKRRAFSPEKWHLSCMAPSCPLVRLMQNCIDRKTRMQ